MTFAHPAYFLLLLLIVPFIAGYVLLRRQQEPALRFASTEAFRRISPTPRTTLRHLPFAMRLLAFVMLICVLARPQTRNPIGQSQVEGIDIVIAMDISESMLTNDLEPNRIEAAKQVAYEFIAGRENDNIGLTLFSGEAFTQCPMTTDHTALLAMFRNVSCDLSRSGVIANGTAIGMGLTNAISHLAKSKAKSKVVILITDGANNAGDISPLTAADVAKKQGIRIYTIAVGQQEAMKQPIGIRPDGSIDYVTVKSDMDPKTLRSIANITGGLYYAATSKTKLRDIYRDIDKLERSKFEGQSYNRRYEAFQPFALALFLLLLTEIILRLTWLRRIP